LFTRKKHRKEASKTPAGKEKTEGRSSAVAKQKPLAKHTLCFKRLINQ
jgi:hypothetical protein